MYEVEVKVRADRATVRERLSERGAEPLGAVTQVDTYYDAPHRDFAATDEALRIREEAGETGTTTELTYKGPLVEVESKTREEVETGIEDGDALGTILDALGFEPAATVRKERERFALDGYTVTLDAVEGLGEFVEVETGADAAAVESAREGAFAILQDIGLDPDDHIRTSYLGLLLATQRDGADE